MSGEAPDPWKHHLRVDMKKVRKLSKGEVWFRQNCTFPDPRRWTVGVGKYHKDAPTMEEALAHILTQLHRVAANEGFCE